MNFSEVNYKKLLLFFSAAISLLLAGSVATQDNNWLDLLIIISSSILGVFWVYRVNDVIDYDANLAFNLKQFFSSKIQLITSLSILLLIVFGWSFISKFRFIMFAFVGLLGFLYSISIKFGSYNFRLKNIFFLKNLSIGLAWGSLVLIGAGNYDNKLVVAITVFTCIQVFIGSMIRDIPDKQKDEIKGVKSFPVVIGERQAIVFMQLVNIFSFSILVFLPDSLELLFLLITIIIWRFINLFMLSKDYQSALWGQTVNLLTCIVIFVVVLIQKEWMQ